MKIYLVYRVQNWDWDLLEIFADKIDAMNWSHEYARYFDVEHDEDEYGLISGMRVVEREVRDSL